MLTRILRRYQQYDPETGQFDRDRSLRAYAQTIGVNVATLSQIFNGVYGPSIDVMRALAQAFPASAPEIAAALATPDIEPERVPA